jgi:uridine kinase
MNNNSNIGAVESAVLSRLTRLWKQRRQEATNAAPLPILIAITGGSGSGKSWLADRLQQAFGKEAARLSLDDFYRDLSSLAPAERKKVNFDHPRSIDWLCVEHVLSDCRAGRLTRVPRYDFKTHTRVSPGEWFKPKLLNFMDGLWLLNGQAMRDAFDLKIFIDCSRALRLERRLTRDVAERGRSPLSVRRQFEDTVAPMHDRHVAPKAHWADIILKQPLQDKDIHQLADQIWALLSLMVSKHEWMRTALQTELCTFLKSH